MIDSLTVQHWQANRLGLCIILIVFQFYHRYASDNSCHLSCQWRISYRIGTGLACGEGATLHVTHISRKRNGARAAGASNRPSWPPATGCHLITSQSTVLFPERKTATGPRPPNGCARVEPCFFSLYCFFFTFIF